MNANEYQKMALRTANTDDWEELMLNGSLGICGEGGEIADIVKKYKFQGRGVNLKEMAYELGDLLWYCAILSKGIGYPLEKVMEMNIEKLQKRYPDGFSADKSINRGEPTKDLIKDLLRSMNRVAENYVIPVQAYYALVNAIEELKVGL